jgi:hypothetical protein
MRGDDVFETVNYQAFDVSDFGFVWDLVLGFGI